jgi:hypothetical protein
MRVTLTFLSVFRKSFFFVYWTSYLEVSFPNVTWTRHVTLIGACGPYRAKRCNVGPHSLKNLQEGSVEFTMGEFGRNLLGGWFYSRPSFRGEVGGVQLEPV